MSAAPFDVVVLGMNVVDVLTELPAAIVPDAKHPVETILVQGGGPASTGACQIASLGWRTAFIGRHGDNTISRISEAEFERAGVCTDLFLRADPDVQPAVAIVEVDPRKHERTVYYTLSGTRKLTPEDLPVEHLRAARAILVDGYEAEASRAALRAVRGSGTESVLDLEDGDPEMLKELLGLGSHAILPLEAARRLSGRTSPEEALRGLAAWSGEAQLVVTDGAQGSWALTAEGVRHQPAFPVAVVDTTGCGDAYHAAYLSALLSGWELGLRMEFASWVAGYVAEALGGRTNLPTKTALAARDRSMLSAPLRGVLAGFFAQAPVAA